MDKISFKTIDNVPRFLANIWKLFPSLIAKKHSDDSLKLMLFQPLLLESKEMCLAFEKGIVKIKNKTGEGAVGAVGDLFVLENKGVKQIKGITVSVKPEEDDNDYPGFEPFYMDLILKKCLQTEFLKIYAKKFNNIMMIGVSDPFSETIFGAFVSHVYDLGFTTLPMKMFGSYVCPSKKDKYCFRTISEKSNISFYDLIDRDNKYLNYLTSKDLINFLIQYIYGLFVLKYYYGFVDYDTHLSNIMITFTKTTNLSQIYSKDLSPYYYHAKNLSKIEYFVYKYPDKSSMNTYIVINNIGLTKLIDYGGCAVQFKHSANYTSYNLALFSINVLQFYIDGDKAFTESVSSKAYANTIDIYYALINLYYVLLFGLDKTQTNSFDINVTQMLKKMKGNKNKYLLVSELIKQRKNYISPKQRQLLQEIMPFLDVLFPPKGIEDYLMTNNIGPESDDFNFGNFGSRNVGTKNKSFDNPKYFLELIIKYLTSIGHFSTTSVYANNSISKEKCKIYWLEGETPPDINSENSVYFSLTNTIDGNNLNEYMEHNSDYYESCDMKISRKIFQSFDNCQKAKVEMEEFNPNNTKQKSIIKHVLNKNNVKLDELKNYQSFNYKNMFSIYDLYIYPAQLNMTDMKYNNKQLWFNYNKINKEKIGKYIEIIVLYIITVKQPVNIEFDMGVNLWKAAQKHLSKYKSGFSVNGNFFITERLTDDKNLHPNMKASSIEKPIGFFYDEDDIKRSGTLAPIPASYRNMYAAIITVKERMPDGKIKSRIYFDRYSEFIDKHATIEIPEYISEYNDDKWMPRKKIMTKIISVNKGKEYGGKPDTNINYSKAFVSGPILVWNGKLVFTENVMIDSKFSLETAKKTINYIVYTEAKTPSKYFAEENEYVFPYGQRLSNLFVNQTVMAQDKKGDILFFLLEGRGYGAPGLPRDKLAELVSKFDILHAVSLDGGFSTNVVVKNPDNKYEWLLNDPEKRVLGLSLSFGFD